ncbi:unnamed protein product [Moneuplotes crassus]|uniref:Uncharacterized protein n=1 Tax=Euplotes crassus TaxID=5936 RepID=A0AAD1XS29_EUPCR|nr:unnamed protein product [Moneuplotes crassus]
MVDQRMDIFSIFHMIKAVQIINVNVLSFKCQFLGVILCYEDSSKIFVCYSLLETDHILKKAISTNYVSIGVSLSTLLIQK